MAFDFGVIGQTIAAVFDGDYMDIGRKGYITGSDGIEIELDPNIPIYKHVPCHISYQQQDNPDVGNTPTKPIIMSLQIYCNPLVDIKNGDLVKAYKCSGSGEVLELYQGIAGEPEQYQSRIEFALGVKSNA